MKNELLNVEGEVNSSLSSLLDHHPQVLSFELKNTPFFLKIINHIQESEIISFLKERLSSVYSPCHSTKEITEKLLDNSNIVFEAIFNEKNQELVGLIGWTISEDVPFGINYGHWFNAFIWIYFLYVKQNYDTFGIEKWLIQHLEESHMKSTQIIEIMVQNPIITEEDKEIPKFIKETNFKSLVKIYSREISSLPSAFPNEYGWRYGEEKDLDFLITAVEDIFQVQQYESWNWKEERILCLEGLKKKEVVFAMNNGELIGTIWFIITNSCPFGIDYPSFQFKFIWTSIVHTCKSWRNKGVAKFLYDLQEALCYEMDKSIRVTYLDVHSNNPISEDSHKRLGFKPFLELFSKKSFLK